MKYKVRKNILWLFLLLISILFMSIGYAAINAITIDITGVIEAEVQEGVFITNVEYVSDVDANEELQKYKIIKEQCFITVIA